MRSIAPTVLRVPTLALLSLGCFAVLAVQQRVPGHYGLEFLVWNLFLAWVPLGLAVVVERLRDLGPGQRRTRVAFAAGAGAWLLFFPNAPYIVTDLIHLHHDRGERALLADGAVIAAFALTGLLLAFASLRRMQRLVVERFGASAGWALVAAVSLLTGAGVYLGRVLRWNSWDLLSRPDALLTDLVAPLGDPLAYQRPLAVAVGFGLAFLVWYVGLFRLTEARARR
jgi:uncharacterized membrane protein